MTFVDDLITKYGVLMSVPDLADLFKVKNQTLYNKIYSGTADFIDPENGIPHLRRGRKYFFATRDVAQWVAKKS